MPGVVPAATPPPGFVALFNGRDLAGWRGGTTYDPRALLALPGAERDALIAKWTASLTQRNEKTGLPHWRAERGELINDGFGDYVTTANDYGDFELRLEYKTVPRADSGIYLRGYPQVQIWDINQRRSQRPSDRNPHLGSGGLYNNPPGTPGRDPLVVADKPHGEWNQVRIVMVGERVSVWLNSQLVVDHAILTNHFDRQRPPAERRPILERGPIELQTHGAEIRWRDIFLREIAPAEAAELLKVGSARPR
jgi:hypothetical protein